MKTIKKIISIYRIKDWIHYLGYNLIAFSILKNFDIFTILLSSLLLSFAYSFNDYTDKNIKKRFFLCPLFLFFLFIPLLSTFQLLVSFLFIAIFFLYTWKVSYFEGKPIASTISNSIGFTLLFLLPFNFFLPYLAVYFSILLFLLNTIAQLIHEICHYKEDRKIKKITTTVKIGVNKSKKLIRILLLVVLFFSFIFFEEYKTIFFSTFLFSIYFLLKSKKIDLNMREEFKKIGIIVGIIWFVQLNFT